MNNELQDIREAIDRVKTWTKSDFGETPNQRKMDKAIRTLIANAEKFLIKNKEK